MLVTSRDHLTGLITGHHHLPIDGLEEADALALLTERLGAKRLAAEPNAVDDLLSWCGGYPRGFLLLRHRLGG